MVERKRQRLGRRRVVIAALLVALLSCGCGEKPEDARTRPPVTFTAEDGQRTAVVNLQNVGAVSVLEAIRGPGQLDGLDYAAPKSKPTPVILPQAAPELGALLLFPEGTVYDPANPAQTARIREAFGPKQPAALRLQAMAWVSAKQDTRFVEAVAGELKPGSLIASSAAEALAGYAGTSAADTARQALVAGLASSDYLIRAAAIKALARIGDTRSLPALRDRLALEQHQYNRVLLCHALGYLVLHGQPSAGGGEVAAVQTALRKPQTDVREDQLVRAEAAVALAATGDTRAEVFLKSLADRAAAPEMRYLGIEGLVVAGAREAPLYVLAGLNNDSPVVWAGALQLCGQVPLESILPALEKTVREGDRRRAVRAALALAFLRQDSALDWLPYIVETGETGERLMALELLGGFHRLEYADSCARFLTDPNPVIREGAARALYLLNATSYAARIAEAAREGNPYTRSVLTEIAARLARNADAAVNLPAEVGGNRPGPLPGRTADARQLETALVQLQRATLVKLRMVGVAMANGRPVAAVFRDSEGREKTVLVGEYVYGAFALAALNVDGAGGGAAAVVAQLDDGQTQADYRQNQPPTLSVVAKAVNP